MSFLHRLRNVNQRRRVRALEGAPVEEGAAPVTRKRNRRKAKRR